VEYRHTLEAYLSHFLHSSWTENVEHTMLIRIHCLSRCLTPTAPTPPRPNQRRRFQVLDVHQVQTRLVHERHRIWKSIEEQQSRALQRFDGLYRHSAEAAVRATHQAIEAQHEIRRVFLDGLRVDGRPLAASAWARLVDQMTHQRAPWFFPRSYLKAWQLDPSEGYQRARIRLQRCPLHIDPKYILSTRSAVPPLSFTQFYFSTCT